MSNQRALAHIEKVTNIRPILGADNIEQCNVLGWNLITKKGEFHDGDKCVYIEIDSKCPEIPEFEFLRSKDFKVKTMKLGKFNCISQGLALPVTTFPKLALMPEGTDVTNDLGITYYVAEDNVRKANNVDKMKYQSMMDRRKKLFSNKFIKRCMKYGWFRKMMFFFFGKKADKPLSFPNKFDFVTKTDETRCENIPSVLLNKEPLIKTLKIDGCLDRGVSVYTDSGPLLISDIVNHKLPVNVLTWNERLQCCEFKPIASYHKWKRVSDMYDIEVRQVGYYAGNKPKHIKCTADHKFYIGNNQYKKASELSENDKVYHRVIHSDAISEQILLGILLGDGSLDSRYGNIFGGVNFSHSDKQEAYIKETVRLLGINATLEKNITSGFGSNIFRAHCCSTENFKNIVKSYCARDGKKYVTKEWCDLLTPISLAFWYMDDGCIANADSDKLLPKIRLATNSFTDEECANLVNALEYKFGIKSKVFNSESYKGNTIVLDTKNTDKFITLVAPFICDSMRYKIPKKKRNILYSLKDYVCTNYDTIIPIKIESIRKIKNYNRRYVFDLTIDSENSNYFANGVLTHNTSATYVLERKPFGKYEYYVCSRNVRQADEQQRNYHSDFTGDNVYWAMEHKYHICEFLKDYIKKNNLQYACLQGEIAGPSIQGNPHKLATQQFYAFNLIRSDVGRVNSVVGQGICRNAGINWVPIIDTRYILPDTMEELKLEADGPCEIGSGLREGYVYRNYDNTLSFKNVSRKYLLKHS